MRSASWRRTRNAGDPGSVPARRLSNAEYDHTIRDLTGVDLRPTREFPVDPANEAGFDNSAESLAMSPALVKKYLQAARDVADHLVLTPDGLAFAPHPMLADTDRDKYCVNAVIDFYNRQNTDYADYFLAAWRFQHRVGAGQARRLVGRRSPPRPGSARSIWRRSGPRSRTARRKSARSPRSRRCGERCPVTAGAAGPGRRSGRIASGCATSSSTCAAGSPRRSRT